MKRRALAAISLVLACAFLAGCGARTWHKGGVAGGRPYTVRGVTYYPLKSARGFVEEGTASWYGPGFHGKATATGETYDQDAMTAAHKILPLGTRVRVTHLGSGRSVIVRVNDRGPFVNARVIDLSRAAARRLDMVRTGTALVRVQSLDAAAPPTAAAGPAAQPQAGAGARGYYVQVGAFSSRENALRLIATLIGSGHKGRLLRGGGERWLVQVGPWQDALGAEENLEAFRPLYGGAFVVPDAAE